MNRRINLISLFLFLILNNHVEASTTTTTTAANATPPDIENLPLKNFQKVVSNCEAIREVFDHEGGAAGFTSNCTIRVWNDKTSSPTDLKDLTPEQQEKLKEELNKNSEPSPSPLDQIKLLQEEAANRHYMCMEAKRSILYQLKQQLPAGLNDCDKINQVLNDLKLSPLLEAFINKVSGPMKEIVARIHAIEQDKATAEADKLEALRKEKSELTRLLDEDCKDDHPSIRFHNISALPSPDLQRLKMTLFVTHPDRKIEFFNLPAEGMGPLVEYLRSMAQAAAHHFQVTGQTGYFKAHLMSGPRCEGATPGVISFVPAAADEIMKKILESKPVETTLNPEPLNQEPANNKVIIEDSDILKKVKDPVILNQGSSDLVTDTNTSSTTTAQSSPTLADIKTPIAKYWKQILDAHETFVNGIKSLNESYDSTAELGKKNLDFYSKGKKEDLDDALVAATLTLIKEAKVDDDSDPPTAKSIEKRYQDSKALLKQARDYMPPEKKKSFLGFPFNIFNAKPFEERMYEFSKSVIKKIRDEELLKLKNKDKSAVNTVPIVNSSDTTANTNDTTVNTGDNNTPTTTAAATVKKPVNEMVAKKQELINNFVAKVSDPSTTLSKEYLNEQYKILFDEETLQKIPLVSFVDSLFYTRSEARKLYIRNLEKMKNLFTEVKEQLKTKVEPAKLTAINEAGVDFINTYIDRKEFQFERIKDGTAKTLQDKENDIKNVVDKLSPLKDPISKDSVEEAFEPLFSKQIVDSMPEVPFKKGLGYSLNSAADKQLLIDEAKRKLLLAEVLSQLKANGLGEAEYKAVEDLGNNYIAELAKPAPALIAPPTAAKSDNSGIVGSFMKRLSG